MNVNTLDYWCRRLRATPTTGSSSPALVPIVVRPSALAPSLTLAALEFEWPNGLRLRTALGANNVELAALMRALSPG